MIFLVIPIGHEDREVRRFPVVSVVILVICVIAFSLTLKSFSRQTQGQRDHLEDLRMRIYHRLCQQRDDYFDVMVQGQKAARASEYELRQMIREDLDRCEQMAVPPEEIRAFEREYEAILATEENESVFYRWGLVPARFSFIALITHMFLHGGWAHLIGNMIFFFLVNLTLEDIWGRGLFLAIYLLSGIAAALSFIAVSGAINVPMVGASGAIAGLMGAFLFSFPRARIRCFLFYWFGFLFRWTIFYVPAWVFLPVWILFEIIQGVGQLAGEGGGGGIAHWAHIGGFFFGVAAAAALKFTGLDRKLYPIFAVGADGTETVVKDPRLAYVRDHLYQRGVDARAGGQWPEATAAFAELAATYPTVSGPWLETAEVYRLCGKQAERREALLQALAVAVRGDDRQTAVETYDLLSVEYAGQPIPIEPLFKVGLMLERQGQIGRAAEIYLRMIKDDPQHRLTRKALLRQAGLLAGPLDKPDRARQLLLKAKSLVGQDPIWLQEIDDQLKKLADR